MAADFPVIYLFNCLEIFKFLIKTKYSETKSVCEGKDSGKKI